MTEIRLVVAVMARKFDVQHAYAKNDRIKGQKTEKLTVNGERAYQIIGGVGHPSENYPCRVRIFRKSTKTTS